MKKWIIYSTQRTYTAEGAEKEAEMVRVQQARRHGAGFRKAEDTPSNREAMRDWKSANQ